jgi:hypothetical protein
MLPRMRKTFTDSRMGKRPRRSRATWLEDVRRWRESGQTAVEYAGEHGLHAGTLMVWGSKLRGEVMAIASRRHSRTGFLPVRVAEPTRPAGDAGGQLEVVLRNGRRVVVSGDFGAQRLARLLEIAEGGA